MSHNETATPQPRIAITPATDPAPPWTGKKFTCSECTGEFQLEAADVCRPTTSTTPGYAAYKTPACPTHGCGARTIIVVPIPLVLSDLSVPSDEQIEGGS